MTDRLTLAHALEEGGIAREPAEKIASEIFDAISANVATKADLDLLRVELKGDIDRIVVRIVAAVVIALGVLFGALHVWPPH